MELEPEESFHFEVSHYGPPKLLRPPHDLIQLLAYGLWQVGFSQDPLINWEEARLRITAGYYGLPTHVEVSISAYFVWKSGYSQDPTENWEEGRRSILAFRVWSNDYIRINIMRQMDYKTLILGVGKINKQLKKDVDRLIVWRSRVNWRFDGLEKLMGRVQVVINATTGEVHLTPKLGFHPTAIFDWD